MLLILVVLAAGHIVQIMDYLQHRRLGGGNARASHPVSDNSAPTATR
ncbi:MAG TPA: hypothetical protein VF585_04455 [Chthoniobacterales bacterium]